MKVIKKIIILNLLVGLFISCGAQNKKDQFINDLISKMTLEEKVGQMTQIDRGCLIMMKTLRPISLALYLAEGDLFRKIILQKVGSI